MKHMTERKFTGLLMKWFEIMLFYRDNRYIRKHKWFYFIGYSDLSLSICLMFWYSQLGLFMETKFFLILLTDFGAQWWQLYSCWMWLDYCIYLRVDEPLIVQALVSPRQTCLDYLQNITGPLFSLCDLLGVQDRFLSRLCILQS